MTNEQLITTIRGKDAAAATRARAELVEKNTGLVVRIAKKYHAQHTTPEDIVQEGIVGLLEGVETFDFKRGTRFTTHVVWPIRLRIQRAVMIGMTTNTRRKVFSNLGRVVHEMFAEGVVQPTDAQLAARLGVEEHIVTEVLGTVSGRASVQPWQECGASGFYKQRTWEEVLEDGAPSPEEQLIEASENRRRMLALGDALRNLDARSRSIVMRRHLAEAPETLKQVGESLGLSRERVRQIEESAFDRMRAEMTEAAA